MILKLARRLAYLTKVYNPEMDREPDELTNQYAIFINTAAVALLTLLIGWVDGRLGASAAAMVAFMTLRTVSGGFHFKSLDVCVIVTVIIFVGIPLIPSMGTSAYVTLNVVSAVIALARSPTALPDNFENRRKVSAWMKAASVVLIVIGCAVQVPAVTIAQFTQTLTLLYTRKEVNDR